MNSPEGELFRKGAILYGLDLARPAIAKQDRAIVVEGYTDVLALHQAGLEPVVASMGTALTERQLKELSRLTQRLYLCFDADAAGEAATLRGMELADRAGLRRARRPAPGGHGSRPTPPDGFDAAARGAEPYLMHRVRLEIDRARRPAGRRSSACSECSTRLPDSPERHEAWRLAPTGSACRVQTAARAVTRARAATARLAEAPRGGRRGSSGSASPACRAHPELRGCSPSSRPSTSTPTLHRRAARVPGSAAAEAGRGARRACGPSSTRARPRKASTSGTARELLLRLARALLSASSPTAGARAGRPSCRRRSRAIREALREARLSRGYNSGRAVPR